MSCRHRQAEPVVLSTGETVATVCISCLDPLSSSFIVDQRRRAEVVAYCTHDDQVELGEFGKEPADWDRMCTTCGAWNP